MNTTSGIITLKISEWSKITKNKWNTSWLRCSHENTQRRKVELWAVILPKSRLHVTFRDLLHAVKLRHGTDGFTSPPKEGVLRIFFALKNPTALAGCEPANLGYQRSARYL